jgi:hypothetical protein
MDEISVRLISADLVGGILAPCARLRGVTLTAQTGCESDRDLGRASHPQAFSPPIFYKQKTGWRRSEAIMSVYISGEENRYEQRQTEREIC